MIRGQYDIVIAGFVALCLVLGGASAAGLLANFILQVLAIGLLVVGFISAKQSTVVSGQPLLRAAAFGAIVVAAMQFLPLPVAVWGSLPGREPFLQGFDLLRIDTDWQQLSLAPYDSLASIVWLLPACAVGYLTSRLLDLRMDYIAAGVVLVALASIPLGGMQVVYGAESGWYIYERSGFGQGAGFFANGNHQATFLLIALALLSALYASYLARQKIVAPSVRLMFASAVLVLICGVLLTGSMAGIGLLIVVLPACYVLMTPRIRLPGKWVLFTAGVVGVAVVVALANSGLQQVGSSLEATGPMSRGGIAATTMQAAWTFFPLGSGIGTFGDLYRMFEDPAQVGTTYINHAHNDYIELLLETGLVGAIVMLLFIAWWTRRSLTLWTGDRKNFYALAGSLSIGVVLVHSIVDYPLRTAAVSVLFALCIALLARSDALWSRRPRKERSDRSKKKKITL